MAVTGLDLILHCLSDRVLTNTAINNAVHENTKDGEWDEATLQDARASYLTAYDRMLEEIGAMLRREHEKTSRWQRVLRKWLALATDWPREGEKNKK